MQKASYNLDTFTNIVEPIKNQAIYTLNLKGEITSWNQGAANIKGWKSKEVLGNYFGFLYLPEDAKSGKPARNLKLAIKNGLYEAEDYRLKKNGTKFLADLTISTIYDKTTGQPIGFVKILKDITKRHQQEADQLDANSVLKEEINRRKTIEKALKESNAELEAFASAASHDLQEPLRMVISYLQLIDRRYRKKFDKDGKEFLEFAVDGAMRMRALISDLVEYARIDTVAKPFKIVKTNLIVDQVLNNLQVSAKDAGAQIFVEDLPDIEGDSIQLSQLFQNLIANAIKFSGRDKPKINVGYKTKDNNYVFYVKDNGKGISKKDYDKIFLIFKQLGPRAERSGSGVGLAISKKIVNRHHGNIWVSSKEGVGSTFYFSLPKRNLRLQEAKNG